MVCMKAIDPAYSPYSYVVIFSKYQYGGPLATGIVEILRGWQNTRDESTVSEAQAIISTVIARVQPRDDSWFTLTSGELGVPEVVLRDYAIHGHSLSLFILIHLVHQQFSHFGSPTWPKHHFSDVLEAASKFDVKDTSPELQHGFRALWNQIVRKAQNDNDRAMADYILLSIRNVSITLHQDTNSAPLGFTNSTDDGDYIQWDPDSYSVCNTPDHHPDSALHIHGDSASATFGRTVPHDHDNTALVPSFPSCGIATTSTSAHAPLFVDESLTDVPPLDDNIPPPVQTTPSSRRIPSTSADPITTLATHGSIDTSTRTISLSTPETLASTPSSKSKVSNSPPDVVAAERTAITHTASGDENVPLSVSSVPALDDILPTGLLLPSDSVVTGSDQAFSSLELHSSKLAPTGRGPSR